MKGKGAVVNWGWAAAALLSWALGAVRAEEQAPVDLAKVRAITSLPGGIYFSRLPTPEEYEYMARAERQRPELLFRSVGGYLYYLKAPKTPPEEEELELFREMSRDRFPYEDERIYPYSVKTVSRLLRGRRGRRLGVDEEAYLRWAFSTPRGRGYVPLDEMKAEDRYKGEDGGLYGLGRNDPPKAHHEAALAELGRIRPLDAEGKPAPGGKIVLLSIGMSNASEGFRCFKSFADRDPEKSPNVVIVDGAQPSQTLGPFIGNRRYAWGPPGTPAKAVWEVVEERLKEAGVTFAQIQAVWLKQVSCPNSGEPLAQTFERNARPVARGYVKLMNVVHERCPNVRLAFFSSRVYGGYATASLHPEPFAYETAFSIRWVIQDQIKGKPELNWDPARGPVRSPLLLWGPYLWADGMNPRKSDGLTWQPMDIKDGTHKSYTGCIKVKDLLLKFFKTSPYAAPWFVKK